MMEKGCSSMQHQRGNDHTVDGRQPVLGITTPYLANGHQMADEAANSENSPHIEMTVKDSFDFLWRLRKYLLLLAVLAVSVTYNAGLSPPGGFWTDNSLDHRAGDPLLPVKFFERYEVFFYCNATAFAASLVLIILLLSRRVASQHVWLRSMQVTMILDLFSLMGAYAAGSCRALRSSVYILVLVCAVFFYVWIHILVFIKIVPNRLKQKVQKFLLQIVKKLPKKLDQVLPICFVSHDQRTSQNENEKEQIEEARKFILMLATFAATITYQAGMSPPGGFWAVNGHGYRPATFVLRRHNLARFNFFICCNATSFVASLVTIILLLSMELSLHGIRTLALFVCVIADLLGLIGAYAAGCCRDLATSLSVVFIIVVVLICVFILVMFFQSEAVEIWVDTEVKPRFDKLLHMLSWHWGRQSSYMKQGISQPTHQQDAERANSESQSTHQQDAEQANSDSQPTHQQDAEQASSDSQPTHHEDAEQTNSDSQPTHQQDAEQANSDSQPTHQQDAEQANLGTEVEQPTDSQQDAIPMGICSSTDSLKSIEGTLPVQHTSNQNAVSSDDQIIEESAKRTYAEQNAPPISNRDDDTETDTPLDNDNTNSGQRTHHQEKSNDDRNRHTDDVRLKKSRTYLLLLAILAVSLTYQAGLNPPGGFWTTNAGNHSAGDPILEDSYHHRYLAFFYFNGTAFAASIVMIIMLLNRKMSDKVIKRRALQTAMVTVLLALMGAFVVGSCREKIKSIYISLVIFFVIAYVPLHVWVYKHVIPERWKHWLTQHVWAFLKKYVRAESPRTDNHSSGAEEKDLERRRNLLLILAVLAATVTYQAGLNPPGGIWPDDNSNVGKPGNPVMQDNRPKRYDVFYYSNAVSFVSSVALIILLVNRESCEHGIRSYALRVCLVAGLLGLLIAYTAGSCRKVKSIIYLIIIAAAVLFCLVIQVLVLSSTEDALKGRLAWLQSSGRANSESNAPGSVPANCEKKERKRHKYLMLLAILAASIAYQAGLNPPGGFWPDDSSDGHKAGNPILKDIYSRRYMVFFVFNSISFMASISVILLLLRKSVRKEKVPLQALHFIMILDLLALMTAYAAGSCRKVRTSIFVFVVVCGVVVYLLIVVILASGIAKWLKERKGRWLPCCRWPSHVTATDALITAQNV